MLVAMRRASSSLSVLPTVGSPPVPYTYARACPSASKTLWPTSIRSTVKGGGNRRGIRQSCGHGHLIKRAGAWRPRHSSDRLILRHRGHFGVFSTTCPSNSPRRGIFYGESPKQAATSAVTLFGWPPHASVLKPSRRSGPQRAKTAPCTRLPPRKLFWTSDSRTHSAICPQPGPCSPPLS
jgi:hypothetical protein